MNESAQGTSRGRWKLIVVVAMALGLLAAGEWSSSRLLSDSQQLPDARSAEDRADNVNIVLKDPAALPAADQIPSVWVIGNSHAYALPGLKQGQRLRTDETGIFIDGLAGQLKRDHPEVRANFYLLAYPNFLPFEMLTRVGHLVFKGHRPTIAIIGLTWRNIARDSLPRHEIFLTYRDQTFYDDLLRMLAAPGVDAAPDVIEEVRAQRRQVEREQDLELLRSDSDRIDEALTDWIGQRMTLMGRSADLRSYLYRTITNRAQQMWSDRAATTYTYDLVDHDYEFNLNCLRALMRLLRAQHTEVICYLAPERTDLPLLMDPDRQNQFVAAFNDEAAQLGITVLDARAIVPNEYWGWEGESPDRSHFTQAGHQRLSEFLYEQAARHEAWSKLARP